MRLGPWEIALIIMCVVILFGARKIPEIMRGLGLGIKEFKSGLKDEENSAKDTEKPEEKKSEGKNESTTT